MFESCDVYRQVPMGQESCSGAMVEKKFAGDHTSQRVTNRRELPETEVAHLMPMVMMALWEVCLASSLTNEG